ncbi:hypothetical protein AB5I41_06820 [Sphingomonas sp. MMS24-JH45]
MRSTDVDRAHGIPPAPTGPTYGSYLALDTLLDAQHPLSDTHNESCCSSSSTRRRSCG